MRILLIVLAALAASGCAVGNRYSYDVSADLAPQGSRTVAVAAQDVRPYVLSGEKRPNYVGTQRGGFGNPFNVGTQSGRPLAEEFSSAITGALGRRGFKAAAVSVEGAAAPDARALAARAGADRVALVQIVDWKSDTMANVALHYDLRLRVLDAGGNELASNSVSGSDNLGGSAWNPPAHARQAVPEAFRQKLQQLFGAPAVITALR